MHNKDILSYGSFEAYLENFIVQQQLGSSFVPFEVHLEKLPGTEIFGKGSAGSMENIYKNFIANLGKVLNLGLACAVFRISRTGHMSIPIKRGTEMAS